MSVHGATSLHASVRDAIQQARASLPLDATAAAIDVEIDSSTLDDLIAVDPRGRTLLDMLAQAQSDLGHVQNKPYASNACMIFAQLMVHARKRAQEKFEQNMQLIATFSPSAQSSEIRGLTATCVAALTRNMGIDPFNTVKDWMPQYYAYSEIRAVVEHVAGILVLQLPDRLQAFIDGHHRFINPQEPWRIAAAARLVHALVNAPNVEYDGQIRWLLHNLTRFRMPENASTASDASVLLPDQTRRRLYVSRLCANVLEPGLQTRERRLAVAMSQHFRLGARSSMRDLNPEILGLLNHY